MNKKPSTPAVWAVTLIVPVWLFAFQASGQVIWNNLLDATNPSRFNPYTAGQFVEPGITVSGIGRGPGIDSSFANLKYQAKNFETSKTLVADDYFSFTITPNAFTAYWLYSATFILERSELGPQQWVMRSSLDNFTSNIEAPVFIGYDPLDNEYQLNFLFTDPKYNKQFDSLRSPITFRLYAYDAIEPVNFASVNEFEFTGDVKEDKRRFFRTRISGSFDDEEVWESSHDRITFTPLKGIPDSSAEEIILRGKDVVDYYEPFYYDKKLTIQDGFITTSGNGVFTIGPNATVTGGTKDGFLSGRVRRVHNGSGTLSFPVGDINFGAFKPVSVLVDGSGTNVFEVEYFATLFPGSNYSQSQIDASILAVSVDEYFTVNRVQGNAPARISTGYVAPTAGNEGYWSNGILPTSGVHRAFLSRWNGSKWEQVPMQQTVNGTSNGTLISSPLLNFSPFTFGYTTTASLPVKLTSFSGKATQQGAELQWLVASEENFSHYEVEKSGDERQFKTIGKLPGKNQRQYDYLDAGATGRNFYRLKMVDKDGSVSYSRTVLVEIRSTPQSALEVKVVANALSEASPGLLVRIASDKDQRLTMRIIDQMGRVLQQQPLQVSAGSGVYQVSARFAGKGVFYVQFFGSDGQHHTEKIVRY